MPDAHRNRFSRKPFLFEVADLPFFRRHHSTDFVRQINPRLLSQAQHGRVFRDAVNAKFLRQRVEEYVAGLVDRFLNFDAAMATLHPASEATAIKSCAAVAVHVQRLRNPLLPAGDRHDDLESRAGRELRLDGLIQKWFIGIGDQLRPFVFRNLDRKIIRIEGRTAHHRQNFPGMRIHRDERAILPIQRLLRCNLQIQIDRQLQLFAGLCRSFIQPPDFPSVAVNNRAPRSVLAHEHGVVLLLDTALSDYVAGVVKLKLRLIEHVLGDFTDIANQVRHESVAWIQAPVRHDGVEFRQFILVRFNECQFVWSDVFFQKDWLVTRH